MATDQVNEAPARVGRRSSAWRLPAFVGSSRLGDNRDVAVNATSLLATTAVTSLLGFVYWWVAARLFSEQAVGLASAGVSAMTLLGTFGMFGFGTVLIGELARDRRHATGVITAALAVVTLGAALLGLIGALVMPLVSSSLGTYSGTVLHVAVFAVGVAATAATLVLDQAFIGLLRGGLQLARNSVFSLAKLLLLFAASAGAATATGLSIFDTWVGGTVLSVLALAGYMALRGLPVIGRPRWSAIQELRATVFWHNSLNSAMQAPRLLLPVLVTAVVSARANAAFYAAWLIAGFLYMVPTHLSTVLYATGAGDRERLAARVRFTLTMSALAGLLGCLVLAAGAEPVLRLFGASYADQATGAMRVLAIGVVPTTVKMHFTALCRVRGRVTRATVLMTLGGALELAGASVGGVTHGLLGLSVGLVVAMSIVAATMVPEVVGVLSFAHRRPPENADGAPERGSAGEVRVVREALERGERGRR